MKDGRLVRQRKGIPMGDALSPAMTIGTCGWMEREWMDGLDEQTRRNFRAKRYMDDIVLAWSHGKAAWDQFLLHVNAAHERISVTSDTSNPLPVLDTVLYIEDGRIAWEFFEKPTASNLVLPWDSAHGERHKLQYISNEALLCPCCCCSSPARPL